MKSEQPSGSLTQEIEKDVLFGCESINVSTERFVKSCVLMSVDRLENDKRRRRKRRRTSNKHGETRWKWTIHRFVHAARGNRHWLLSVWIGTCRCETSRKLPCSRTREEDRESSSSTKHFKAICNKITSTTHSVTMRKRWFVKWAMWSCSSYAKQFQKCNAQNAFFIGIKELSIAFADISWVKANPAKVFTNGDWMLSQLPHYVIKKERLHGARHG